MKYIEEQKAVYETGRRHLAAIMGKDPHMFDQNDIDVSCRHVIEQPSRDHHRAAGSVANALGIVQWSWHSTPEKIPQTCPRKFATQKQTVCLSILQEKRKF